MSNELATALEALVNRAPYELLDIPHPADTKDVRVIAVTQWHSSVLKKDREKTDDGDFRTDIVKGRIIEKCNYDEYGEPDGEPRLMLEHKYSTPSRPSKDVSVTALKPL